MKLTGAQALIKSLEMEQVEVMFGLPGGAILPGLRPAHRQLDPAHPRAARAGRGPHGERLRVGSPAGPGLRWSRAVRPRRTSSLRCATRTWTRCRWSSSPVRSPYAVIGTDAFQEADTVGITMPITKHNWLITDAQDIPRVVREAFHVATTGRPGPVLIDLPKDVANAADGLVLARKGRSPRLQAQREGPPEADQGRGAASSRTRSAP